MPTVPPLVLRIPKAAPLSALEGDDNLKKLRDFCNGLSALFDLVFLPDGTLRPDVVTTLSILNRAITQPKLAWLANFYAVAGGTDAYTATINPDDDFDLGDGLTSDGAGSGAFMLPVKFTNANTGPSTLDVNGAGAKNIYKDGNQPLAANDILAGSIHILIYDGLQFQLTSQRSEKSKHGISVYAGGASGNFTVPVGVYVIDVECVGGGGGGGGSASARGGGGGGYVYKRMTVTPGDVIAYSVGNGGIGATGAGNNSTNGGDTTFSTMAAGGGKNGDAGLGVGGTAAGGDINIPGQEGWNAEGRGGSGGPLDKCEGGSSRMGLGSVYTAGGVVDAVGYGAGGGGDVDAGAGWQSYNGTDGIIIVKW